MSQLAMHGVYSLFDFGTADGRKSIRRQDADAKRTVCFVDSVDEWERFVAAIEGGADEVAAVHAIDTPIPATTQSQESGESA